MATLKIKVCGMRDTQNIQQVVALQPEYLGFIFYSKSKRYVGTTITNKVLALIPESILKVGVFVDEPMESLLDMFYKNNLGVVQLHGNESADYCEQLQQHKITIIKVFNVDKHFCFAATIPYAAYCNYFLFDTVGKKEHGGTGKKFDWSLLSQYKGSTPFFLSGGISVMDMNTIKQLALPALYAVDVNSHFETTSGLKDIASLQIFMSGIRNTTNKIITQSKFYANK